MLLYVQGDSTFVYHPADSSFTLLFDFSMQQGDVFTFNERNSIYASHFPQISQYEIYYTVIETGQEDYQGNLLRYYVLRPDSTSESSMQGYVHPLWNFKISEQIGAVST